MSEIRVLLVDDSTLARRMMVTALANHPEIEVVGSVPTGGLALMRLEELRPDAVILDVEMPGIDGVETLKLIRAIKPKLPGISVSSCKCYVIAGNGFKTKALHSGQSINNTSPKRQLHSSPRMPAAWMSGHYPASIKESTTKCLSLPSRGKL